MTEAQIKYIQTTFTQFAETLTPKQIKVLYHRLDDLVQYERPALFIASEAISKIVFKPGQYDIKEEK
ncbi:hypothetical protein LCGC14_2385400 [marine sediment metagenome]|uniref:Uncharacterized protein n=1 Tax=marine sediment metagenome TaxID=412755 RepID=A0A0F9EC33_9ZZZZ